MKLSEATRTILSNFAKINNHIVINPGNILRTVNEKKNRMVSATVEENFPVEIPMHDLSGFLKTITLFEDPEFEFGKNSVVIADGTASQTYYYSDKEDLVYEEREPMELPFDFHVCVEAEQLARVLKAAATNGVEDIAIQGENGKVYLKAMDKENPKRTFSIEIGEEDLGDFTVYLKHQKKGVKLVLLPLAYQIDIAKVGAARFVAQIEDIKVEYVMAIERDSVFA